MNINKMDGEILQVTQTRLRMRYQIITSSLWVPLKQIRIELVQFHSIC